MDRTVKTDPIIKTEPTVKILLALIAVGLFANLMRPYLAPTPVLAAPLTTAAGIPAIAMDTNSGKNRALVVQNGTLYKVDYSNDTPEITGRVRLK